MKETQKKLLILNVLTILISASIISGCSGAMTRKSPEELAATPDSQLCESYFIVTGNAHAATMEIGKKELKVIFDEFLRRDISPETVAFHCSNLTE